MDLAAWGQGISGRLNASFELQEDMELRNRGYYVDALPLISEIRDACKDAPMSMLKAIDSALILGTLMGLSETWSSSWHYYRSPAGRRQRLKDGASRGGRKRWRNRDAVNERAKTIAHARRRSVSATRSTLRNHGTTSASRSALLWASP